MDTKDDDLSRPKDREAQRTWDEDYMRRTEDLQRSARTAIERRRFLRQKLEELTLRWRGLEQRRLLRDRDYFQRCLTKTSMYRSTTF